MAVHFTTVSHCTVLCVNNENYSFLVDKSLKKTTPNSNFHDIKSYIHG